LITKELKHSLITKDR